ncbi:Tyrosine-protein phosphatase YwqE [Fervidicola ferrireducens]|uniref:protein-tyrosine-phosphatase n=1 Tax=Fervidicola ferrireducens TaxID=520764 RepID=A0A140LCR9_9FIRM|nr:CpsB/CapC family capsule biosynthesis tyrosine phosphatase [Fervidicola ferrireducens]KXG78344.1 Tyrosine-protein phosphatase YwqE [Fervidicola ferrireducens]
MIDIHAHILPGIDDGSPDLETSLKMAEIAASEGIKKMVATPHFIPKEREVERELILEKVDELNNLLRKKGIDLEIYPGQEVFLSPEIPELLDKGRLITLFDGGKYLLVELPMMSIPQYALNIIHSIHLRGIKVILAHPERNMEIANDVNRLRDFVRIGALVQVNSLSLTGVFGRTCQKVALKIVRSGLAHIIATDCHTARSRAPRVKKAANLIGEKTTKLLAKENPFLIMEGKEVETSVEVGREKRFGLVERITLLFNSLKTIKE